MCSQLLPLNHALVESLESLQSALRTITLHEKRVDKRHVELNKLFPNMNTGMLQYYRDVLFPSVFKVFSIIVYFPKDIRQEASIF